MYVSRLIRYNCIKLHRRYLGKVWAFLKDFGIIMSHGTSSDMFSISFEWQELIWLHHFVSYEHSRIMIWHGLNFEHFKNLGHLVHLEKLKNSENSENLKKLQTIECIEHFENWLVALGASYKVILDSTFLSLVTARTLSIWLNNLHSTFFKESK